MAQELRQSTSITLLIGPFIDETDGKTAETGLTIAQADVRLSKNAGNMAQKNEATSCTHDELGYYGCPVDTTDTNTLGRLKLMVHESGALPVWHDYMVVTQQFWDSKYSTDKLQVDVLEVSGDSTAADNLESYCDGTTPQPVNATQISGDGTAADNLETACDGGSYNIGGGGAVAASVAGAVGSVTGNVGGNVAGSVGSVTGNVGGNVTGTIGGLAAQAKTDVNDQALDVINGDTYGEPGQGAPGATLSIAAKINYIFKWARNKITQTATTMNLFGDDGSTVDQKATVSDDGTTYTRGEIGSGP